MARKELETRVMDKDLLVWTVMHLQQEINIAKSKAKDILHTIEGIEPMLKNLTFKINQWE